MIRYSYARTPEGPRYSSTQRRAARALDVADAPATLSDEAVAAMSDPDGIRAVVDVLFEVESNRLRRPVDVAIEVAGVGVAPASGDVASLVNGRRVATAATPAVVFPVAPAGTRQVRLSWDDARPVNVVEVHGDSTVGQITSVRVSTLAVDGSATVRATSTSPAGRIASQIAPYDSPITCHGVLVEILTADGGADAGVAVVEVDPMLIRDVSDAVETLDVEFAAEADAGQTTDPFGNYAASEVALSLDDTAGLWNPATNSSLDVGHRIEVAFGVQFVLDGLLVEELLPAGVFYSEPFDTSSDSTTVSINGTDRLGRNADSAVSEQVQVGATVEELILDLARKYLDLDADQVVIDPTLAATVLPYAYPSGNLGSYLADVAKALGATMHMDPLDRLAIGRRAAGAGAPVAEVRDDTSLTVFRRPPGYDVTTSVVTVTASPLTLDVDSELWAMPSGGITIGVGASYVLVAAYGAVPAINGYVTGIVADGTYTVTAAAYYSDRAELTILNTQAGLPLVVADLRVRGNPLVEQTLTARAVHQPSVDRYGPRELPVDARLVQTQAMVEQLAAVLLDTFRSIDDNGKRRLPDLSFDGLGLPHLTAGDTVTLVHAGKGLGGDYVVLSRKLAYSGGALLMNDVRVREAPSFDVLSLDSGELLDDGHLVGY